MCATCASGSVIIIIIIIKEIIIIKIIRTTLAISHCAKFKYITSYVWVNRSV